MMKSFSEDNSSKFFLISAALAIYFAISFSMTADAAPFSRLASWHRPSLLKQPLHKMLLGGREHETQVASNIDMAISSPINNAVFCVRGGGSNGPCIGIDLGESSNRSFSRPSKVDTLFYIIVLHVYLSLSHFSERLALAVL